jgi:hypothetical protein
MYLIKNKSVLGTNENYYLAIGDNNWTKDPRDNYLMKFKTKEDAEKSMGKTWMSYRVEIVPISIL